jgi:hypothetical protein
MKERLVAEHGFMETSRCWFDVIEVNIGGKTRSEEKDENKVE